ncbi:hypothetical protein J4Q44_G00147410 [Coregonus suidteri]|uniref:RanBD1 domain-containing protein n=1 Tax=Coregonus suidteri TaxID=861788 RepID=A0AAN8LT12_9TELE
MVMSPPKFLSGTDSLQKIFGSSPPVTTEGWFFQRAPRLKTAVGDLPALQLHSKSQISTSSTQIGAPRYSMCVCCDTSPYTAVTCLALPAPSQAEADDDAEVEVVYVRQPTAEQALLARELLLPLTFSATRTNQDIPATDQSDDEDFETAVKALNGKLYQDLPKRKAASAGSGKFHGQSSYRDRRRQVLRLRQVFEGLDPEVVVVWEKRPTPEEGQKARNLQLPSTFFCGVGSDSEAEKDKTEDFETEIRKAQALVETKSGEEDEEILFKERTKLYRWRET